MGAERVVLARLAPAEWYLSAERSLPRDQLYRALLSERSSPPRGLLDPSLLGDAGLRMRASGVTRLLCVDGPEPGSILLAENPVGEARVTAEALAGLLGATDQGRWVPSMAVTSGMPEGVELEAVAVWLSLLTSHPGQTPLSATGAQSVAAAFGARAAAILRPDGETLLVTLGSEDEKRQGALDLGWPLPNDQARVGAALDGLSSRPPTAPWDVLVATRGELALAVSPPSSLRRGLALVANFLAADSERTRTTREGRQRSLLEERMRIAGMIHDGVTQQVSNVVIQLQLLELSSGDPERLVPMLRAAREATASALEELRSSLYELAPRLPDWDDLVTGLRSFAEDYSAQWGIDVTVQLEGEARTLDPETMMLAYSAIQEGLTNVRKHAEADSVIIGVDFGPEELVLQIEDDGRGFPDESGADGVDPEARRMGLRLLQDRVRQAGGSLSVTSSAGEGTDLQIHLPI